MPNIDDLNLGFTQLCVLFVRPVEAETEYLKCLSGTLMRFFFFNMCIDCSIFLKAYLVLHYYQSVEVFSGGLFYFIFEI